MPLITKPSVNKKHQLKIRLEPELLEQIKDYCSWAELGDNLDYFFAEAATMVLEKDKEWLTFKKNKKTDN